MKLIPLREYTLRFDKPIGFYSDQLDYYEGQSNAMTYVISYAKFLSQKLELWMFVPCKLVEGVWVGMEQPGSAPIYTHSVKYMQEYQEAKDIVIFTGFSLKYSDKFVTTVSNEKLWFNFKIGNIFVNDKVVSTIEDLVKYNLELTPTAQKQICHV